MVWYKLGARFGFRDAARKYLQVWKIVLDQHSFCLKGWSLVKKSMSYKLIKTV